MMVFVVGTETMMTNTAADVSRGRALTMLPPAPRLRSVDRRMPRHSPLPQRLDLHVEGLDFGTEPSVRTERETMPARRVSR